MRHIFKYNYFCEFCSSQLSIVKDRCDCIIYDDGIKNSRCEFESGFLEFYYTFEDLDILTFKIKGLKEIVTLYKACKLVAIGHTYKKIITIEHPFPKSIEHEEMLKLKETILLFM